MVGRFGLRVMTGLALAAAATLIITIIWASEKDPAPPDRGPAEVVRIGVVEGQSVPGYLDSSRGELDSLAQARRRAVRPGRWSASRPTSRRTG